MASASLPAASPLKKVTALDLLNQITSPSGLPPAGLAHDGTSPSAQLRPQSDYLFSSPMARKESIWAPNRDEVYRGQASPGSAAAGWSKAENDPRAFPGSLSRGSFGTPKGTGSPLALQSPGGFDPALNHLRHYSSPHIFGGSPQKPSLDRHRPSMVDTTPSSTDHISGYFGGQRDWLPSHPNISSGSPVRQSPHQQAQLFPSAHAGSPSHRRFNSAQAGSPLGLSAPYPPSSHVQEPNHSRFLDQLFHDQFGPAVPSAPPAPKYPLGPSPYSSPPQWQQSFTPPSVPSLNSPLNYRQPPSSDHPKQPFPSQSAEYLYQQHHQQPPPHQQSQPQPEYTYFGSSEQNDSDPTHATRTGGGPNSLWD